MLALVCLPGAAVQGSINQGSPGVHHHEKVLLSLGPEQVPAPGCVMILVQAGDAEAGLSKIVYGKPFSDGRNEGLVETVADQNPVLKILRMSAGVLH